MALGSLSPIGRVQLEYSGTYLAGGTIGTYVSGTSTPAPTYTNAALSVANTNPIVLNSDGACVIYLDPSVGAYKYNIFNALGTQVDTWDPVTATNAGTAGLGEVFVFGGNSSASITSTSYPVGATYDKLLPGTATYYIDSATLGSGTYVLEATGVVTAGGTLTVAIMDMDDGATETPLATCVITSTTGQTVDSAAITFAAPGAKKHYGIKAMVSSGATGFAWGIRTWRTA
jgi:hypothetical protein